MIYNIHPLFVHFPIALLLVYSAIKILPLTKYLPGVAWKHIERALLVFGVLGAFASMSTGEIAEHLVKPNQNLVETHAAFASASTWIYAILLLGEVLLVLHTYILSKITNAQVLKIIDFVEKITTNSTLSKVLAFVGIITISITGLLGGVMVYGVTADPLAPIVLKILGL